MAGSRYLRAVTVVVSVLIVATTVPPAVSGTLPNRSSDFLPSFCYSDPQQRYSRTAKGPYKPLPFEVTDLKSDLDGENIQIGVIRPNASRQRVPVIVHASPYFYADFHDVDSRRCKPRLSENFVPHGYAVAFVAVRGTAGSGGCSDLMGPAEHGDLDQAITWLGRQAWSNGRIAMIGVSYDGSTPWEVASLGNKYLKTIVPIAGVNDPYHLMYGRGVTEWRGPLVLNSLYYTDGFGPYSGRDIADWFKGAICPEAWEGLLASGHSFVTGERDPFGYWTERNSRPGVEKRFRGSIFLVHGLQDWNVDPSHAYPWVSRLERKGLYVKHLLGQWAHAWPDGRYNRWPRVRWDWADILLNWFERWLMDDRSVDLGPRVEVQDSQGRWRRSASWPPREAANEKLYLTPELKLSRRDVGQTDSIVIGPDAMRPGYWAELPKYQGKEMCPGCAFFETARFDSPFRFAGLPRLKLTVTPLGPGGHLGVWLYEDDGELLQRLGWGQVDLRFPQGGESADAVVPGRKLEVDFTLEPLDAVVRRGSRLVVVVSQGFYGDRTPSLLPAPILLEVGAERSSAELSVFDVDKTHFFSPPIKP